jgi:hypothetical protein
MICTLCKEHVLQYGTICPTCTRELQTRLAHLPALWAALEAWLIPAVRGRSQYGGRSAMVEAPLPLNGEVLDLRSAGGIVGVLEDWHDAVRASRDLTEHPRIGSLRARVKAAAWGLTHHIYFIALWDQAPVLGREIGALAERIRRVAEPKEAAPERTFLGPCIAVDASGAVCGSMLYAEPGTPVQCGWCLRPYPPDTWLALKGQQHGDAPGDEDPKETEQLAAA